MNKAQHTRARMLKSATAQAWKAASIPSYAAQPREYGRTLPLPRAVLMPEPTQAEQSLIKAITG